MGGIWVYRRYIRQQERYPNVEFTADVQFIGVQGEYWIVELTATLENKGKARHRMKDLAFDLNGIERAHSVHTSDRWGGQVDFPVPIAKGSFLPARFRFFFVDPGMKAKYSYVTRIPTTVSFAILHCRFHYEDKRQSSHTAERTVSVPARPGASIPNSLLSMTLI